MNSQLLETKLKTNILKQISPSKEEQNELKFYVDEFISKLEEGVRNLNLPIKIKLGGSYAKDTYLKYDFDVDIFCVFQEVCLDKKKEEIIMSLLEHVNIEYRVKHGSRRYFQGSYKAKGDIKFDFECVPTQFHDNVSKIENSTDASIYHVDFFNSQKKSNPNLPNEVRLAKQWFKAQELYGAESYIGGFSGHSIECLVVKLQSFESVVKYLSSASKDSVLLFESLHSKFKLSKDKYSALMIQDPIMSNRNALSALEDSMFYEAKYKSILAIKNGFKEEDFLIKEEKYEDIKSKLINNENISCLVIEFIFSNSEESSDSIGSKSKKIIHKVTKYLSNCGFDVSFRSFMYDTKENKILSKLEFKSLEISKTYLREGPSLELNNTIILDFLKSNFEEEIIIVKDKLCIRKEREFNSIKQFVEKFNDKDFFLEYFSTKEMKSLKKINLFM